ncbi:hypothetical protein CI109_103781 [Kwoniella shandongensis]|uniref:Uncharacterized protein n=1 Tax=Kwoniella shandongensis TaxID=1734106 RepID=A0A5M6C8K3_9TREE|nr:uncharacterized protein CI109_000522 [Kwoniella shandongensis]KAA5530950.1 hypothetical protein CI109_000522 [Kwoniella shandongensis]
MVQVYKKTHSYPDPPPTPLLAFFLRYPNPFARHVLSVDVLDRTVNTTTGQIHTTRLILKRGILPKWATRWLPNAGLSGGRGLDAWILEESIIDPPGWGVGSSHQAMEDSNDTEEEMEFRRQPRLRVQQGNLNHRKLMHIIESGELRAGPNGTTTHHTKAEVRSHFGGAWSDLIRGRIESYGVGRFEGNSETSRKGMSLILTLLRNRHPLPETAEFEFYPPPPPGFKESWLDLPEASKTSSSASTHKEGSPRSFFLSPRSLAAWARARARAGRGSQDADVDQDQDQVGSKGRDL